MKKMIRYVGLDVHKNSIAVSIADEERNGEVRFYGTIPNDMNSLDKILRKITSQKAQRKAKQQLGAFLLRHHCVYSGKSKWTQAHFNWLADITMPHPAQQITLQEYIDTVKSCGERVNRITAQIRQLAEQSPQKEVIKALQSLRGVSLVVAATVVAELGCLRRFARPDQLMAYLGLVPSEHSSGEKVKKGPITKTGNSHVRKALIEAAQAYRLPARKSRAILKRQQDVPEGVVQIAWDAQCRLCSRYRRMIAGGKKCNVAKTAIARELTGYIWAIAQELPQAA